MPLSHPTARDVPRCSVIIPSYASQETIRKCLDALHAQDAPFPFEVIVVDSGADATASIVRNEYPYVQLVHLPQRVGPETARNEGARRARGDIFAFVDSDCVAASDWLGRLVSRIQEGHDAIGGATANGNPSPVTWAGYFCEFREFLPQGSLRSMPYLSPNTVAYPASVFWSLGGFPAGCYPFEDQVFHKALRERGGRVALDPAIIVAHMHRTEVRDFLAHQRRIGVANARVLRLIGGQGAAFASAPAIAALAMPLLVPYRFIRVVLACRSAADGLLLRSPRVLWLCWRGMWWWAAGFLVGARQQVSPLEAAWPSTSSRSN